MTKKLKSQTDRVYRQSEVAPWAAILRLVHFVAHPLQHACDPMIHNRIGDELEKRYDIRS